ncbi:MULTISPECIES: hypothetical protein [unclassified Sinorhizobium]|uniref:hypothetical protein n=1 Tax=unclassified Sinorhizobium TaxID=2613772 RepID=UPI0024C4479B|nr:MULTISPECIES: hypothetical protein [unclassified Sinorhizobium]MDK1376151.1 hypothetical protein [Sinorhizobium sp. 6-70]MDK1480312.1 hypothetical protein [Sinorhizobium sp. 6-117]
MAEQGTYRTDGETFDERRLRLELEAARRKLARKVANATPASHIEPAEAVHRAVSARVMRKFGEYVGQKFGKERDSLREEMREELQQLRKVSREHRDMLERSIDDKIRARVVTLEREVEATKQQLEELRQLLRERKGLRAI